MAEVFLTCIRIVLDDMSSTKGSSARNSCMVEDDGVSVNVLLQVNHFPY